MHVPQTQKSQTKRDLPDAEALKTSVYAAVSLLHLCKHQRHRSPASWPEEVVREVEGCQASTSPAGRLGRSRLRREILQRHHHLRICAVNVVVREVQGPNQCAATTTATATTATATATTTTLGGHQVHDRRAVQTRNLAVAKLQRVQGEAAATTQALLHRRDGPPTDSIAAQNQRVQRREPGECATVAQGSPRQLGDREVAEPVFGEVDLVKVCEQRQRLGDGQTDAIADV